MFRNPIHDETIQNNNVVALTISLVTGRDLGKVSIVVAFHLQVKDFAFGVGGLRDQILVEQALKL